METLPRQINATNQEAVISRYIRLLACTTGFFGFSVQSVIRFHSHKACVMASEQDDKALL